MSTLSTSLWDGPNMRRIGDAGTVHNVRATVIAGPGDTELWEVCASLSDADIPVELAGRGPDIETAAASLVATLAHHFAGAYAATSEISTEE